MTKRSRRGKSIDGRFTPVHFDFVESDVWRLLTPAQQSIWLQMRVQWQRQTLGHYDQKFTCPYDELAFSSATVSAAIKRLIQLGVLTVDDADRGGLYKNATEYRFSKKGWRDYEPTEAERKHLDKRGIYLKGRRKRNRDRRIQKMREREAAEVEGRPRSGTTEGTSKQ